MSKQSTLYVVEVVVVRRELEQDQYGEWCIVHEDASDLRATIAVYPDRAKARKVADDLVARSAG